MLLPWGFNVNIVTVMLLFDVIGDKNTSLSAFPHTLTSNPSILPKILFSPCICTIRSPSRGKYGIIPMSELYEEKLAAKNALLLFFLFLC